MHVKKHQTCRICGNPHLTEVLDLGMQHIQGAFEHPNSPSPPRRKVRNRIVRCNTSKNENACGLVQADSSVSPEILYRNYWYQSGISQTMKNHLKSIVDDALEITGFENGLVLDVASNDGTLLRSYPDSFEKVGIDPSNIAFDQKDFRVINDVFPSMKLNLEPYDIITSIACFYDVNEPEEFVREIKGYLAPDGIWILEVAYLKSILKNLAFDQILLEHCSHYHLAPLEYLINNCGLKIFRAKETDVNGGSIMCYVCHKDCVKYDKPKYQEELRTLRFNEFELELDEAKTYARFRDNVTDCLFKLRNEIKKIVESGKTIHLYGASTKVNVILEAAKIGPELVAFAAERSPEKFGAKTLSNIEILSEASSKALNPNVYLCSLIGFKKEVLEREKDFINSGGSFLFPLPSLCMVDKYGEHIL